MKYFYHYKYTPQGLAKRVTEIGTHEIDAYGDGMQAIKYWIQDRVYSNGGYDIEIIELYIV